MSDMAGPPNCWVSNSKAQILKLLLNRAPRLLMPMLTEIFPYMTRDIYIQECYVKNLLHVTLYIPSLRQSILELIVDKMIKLDVGI